MLEATEDDVIDTRRVMSVVSTDDEESFKLRDGGMHNLKACGRKACVCVS